MADGDAASLAQLERQRAAALTDSLREEATRLRERCDDLARLELEQRAQAEAQFACAAELRDECGAARREAAAARAAEHEAVSAAAGARLQLAESQPDAALRARVAELEARLIAETPAGAESAKGMATIREQLGRMERRVDVARALGIVLASDDETDAVADEEQLQAELQQALREKEQLQERLRGAVRSAPVPAASGVDADEATRLRLELDSTRQQLQHETGQREAAQELVGALQRNDDERVEQMRLAVAEANAVASGSEAATEAAVRDARDAALREFGAELAEAEQLRQLAEEKERGQIAEERRLRRECDQVTSQLEDAKSELVLAAEAAAEGLPPPPPPPQSGTTGAKLSAILRADDGAGPELVKKVSHRDVRELRRERDDAVAKSRWLVTEHELARAQLMSTTTEAIAREQARVTALEEELAGMTVRRADAEQRGVAGEAAGARETQLVVENLGAEVSRLKDELVAAEQTASKAQARLTKSEEKMRGGMESMREGYEEEIGELEAQLAGTATVGAGGGGGGVNPDGMRAWRKRAEAAEESVAAFQEEVSMLRSENAKLSELVRKGAGPSADESSTPGAAAGSGGDATRGLPEEAPGTPAVQRELEELSEQLMAQVESLLAENHALRAKMEAKKARAKEKKRQQGPARGGSSRVSASLEGSYGTYGGVDVAAAVVVTPSRQAVGRPGATPAQPRAVVVARRPSPQRMQDLMYGSNDRVAGSPTAAAAVRTRPLMQPQPQQPAAAAPPLAATGSPSAQTARATSAPAGGVEITAREKRRHELLRLTQAMQLGSS